MEWLHLLSYLFGGAFISNAIPHFVSGMMGKPFQSPFAKPPGEGLSSSMVNAIWGFFNLVVGYCLVFQVGRFDARNLSHIVAFGIGMLVLALLMSRHFGRFNGGMNG